MWQTTGQPKIVDLFQRALENDSLSHAYLLVGPAKTGKMTLALDLARALNCQEEKEKRPCGECAACIKITENKHADVQVTGLNLGSQSEGDREDTLIGIDQIKEMLHSANLPPFEGRYRVYIIDEAGNLSLDAANCLLKVLEEPPAQVVFILLTTNSRSIPATVISRCQKLNLSRLKASEIETALKERWQVDPEKAGLLSRLSQGCLGWAVEAAGNPDLFQERREKFEKMRAIVRGDYSERFTAAAQLAQQFSKKRESVYETLDAWAGWWRDILLAKTGCDDNIVSIDFKSDLVEMAGSNSLAGIKTAIERIRAAGEQLKLNANARLVLESLMLNLPKR
jgi:DNA polymerase-3 subunit delta'